MIDTLRHVVVVPRDALQEGTDGPFVYVVRDDDTVALRRVRVRQQNDREAVIASGIQPQERVVTTAFSSLADGSRVDIAEGEPGIPIKADAAKPPPRAQQRQQSRDQSR